MRLLWLLLPAVTFAQTSSDWWPPRVLFFEREQVMPGKGTEYDAAAEAFSTTITRARVSTHRLGLNPVGGEDQERMFLLGYESMEAVERSRDDWRTGPLRPELEKITSHLAELRRGRITLIARYREDLSYRPASLSLSDARYVFTDQHVVRWGQEAEYADDVRTVMRGLDAADSRRRWYTFEVTAGAPPGTMLRIETYRALSEMDATPEEARAVSESGGGARRPGQRWKATLQKHWTPEVRLLYVNPRTSYPR